MASRDPLLRNASRQFHSLLRDSERAIDIRKLDYERVPDILLDNLPEEDIYLVAAYMTANAHRLITTDRDLFDSVADSEIVSRQMRREFIADYLP